MARHDGTEFLNGLPFHIFLAATYHDAKGLYFVALLGAPSLEDRFANGMARIQGIGRLVVVNGLRNLFAEFGCQFGGQFSPESILFCNERGQAVLLNGFRRESEHRFRFSNSEACAVPCRATSQCEVVFNRAGGQAPVAIQCEGGAATPSFRHVGNTA